MCSCSPSLIRYPHQFPSSQKPRSVHQSLNLSETPLRFLYAWCCGDLQKAQKISAYPSPLGFQNSNRKRNLLSPSCAGGGFGVFEPEKQRSLDGTVEGRTGIGDAALKLEAESEVEFDKGGATPRSSGFDFLEFEGELKRGERGGVIVRGTEDGEEEDTIPPKLTQQAVSESEEDVEEDGPIERVIKRLSGSGKQVMKRSNLLAKQVVSIESAHSLGFVSQLWVDARSWLVVVIEVRSSMLSGENEKFLLEDICQVGDVVLVEDDSVIENELRMVDLDTLVGYNVVTPRRRNVGKVRGYNFNINSGAVESLELDYFGMSIIPASLVSTYCLLVEDVLEVVSDTIVVQETAISRLQRLTKGFWDTRSGDSRVGDIEEYLDFRRPVIRDRRARSKFSRRKNSSKMREIDDDWDMPMEY